MTFIYGIKNCNTMKKAMNWLEGHKVAFTFHDYKKSGVDRDIISHAIEIHGWEAVINRRGTTWRKLPDETQNNMTQESALSLAIEMPSIIKRPLLVHQDKIYLGFDADTYQEIFQEFFI